MIKEFKKAMKEYRADLKEVLLAVTWHLHRDRRWNVDNDFVFFKTLNAIK